MKPVSLIKGKLIDTIDGVVDTWQWFIDCITNLAGDGDHLSVDWTDDTHPVISFTDDDDDDDDDGEDDDDDDGGEDDPIPPLDWSLLFDALRNAGGGHPGPFEPVFEDGTITSFGPGLWPYGRSFRSAVTVDSGALVSSGVIGIEITHGATPTARIVGMSIGGTVSNDDLTKTTIPLFSVADGKISVDYRCLLSLAMRE